MHETLLGLETEIAKAAAPLGQREVVGDHHAAFTRCHMLVRIETECAYFTEASAGLAGAGLPVHFRRIFDHLESMLARKSQQPNHVSREAEDMRDHDCPGARSDACLDLGNIHVPGRRVAIHHHRDRARPYYGCRARDDGESRQNDFVARPDAERYHGRIECNGAIGYGYSVLAADTGGHALFKLLNERALGRYPARPDTFNEVFLFVSIEQRLVDGYELIH